MVTVGEGIGIDQIPEVSTGPAVRNVFGIKGLPPGLPGSRIMLKGLPPGLPGSRVFLKGLPPGLPGGRTALGPSDVTGLGVIPALPVSVPAEGAVAAILLLLVGSAAGLGAWANFRAIGNEKNTFWKIVHGVIGAGLAINTLTVLAMMAGVATMPSQSQMT